MANPLSRFEQRIPQRASALNSPAIREILKLTERPQMMLSASHCFDRDIERLAALIAAHARAHAPALTMDFDA